MNHTPYYHFDEAGIRKNYQDIKGALTVCDKVFYAVKANGEERILRVLSNVADGFDVSSVEEYKKVLSLLPKTAETICSLPVKHENMIKSLYQGGLQYFVFDHPDEYKKLCYYAPESSKILRIAVNDLFPNCVEYGMDLQQATAFIQANNVDGITFFYHPNTEIANLQICLERARYLLRHLNKPKFLNIGGNYHLPKEVGMAYYQQLNSNLLDIKSEFPDLLIYAEPGKHVVHSAGSLITQVILVKKVANGQDDYWYNVYIDAGEPTGIVTAPNTIEFLEKKDCSSGVLCKFYGSLCSHQLLFSYMLDRIPQIGDYLVLRDMGGYTINRANSFHSWKLPKVYYT